MTDSDDCGGIWQSRTKTYKESDEIMYPNNSPLENLAAFAIVFVTGVVSTVAFGKYIEKLKRGAKRSSCT